MNAHLKYCPDLRACELEDRLLPVTPNLGAIVLTTGGYVLVLSPFPVFAAAPSARRAALASSRRPPLRGRRESRACCRGRVPASPASSRRRRPDRMGEVP